MQILYSFLLNINYYFLHVSLSIGRSTDFISPNVMNKCFIYSTVTSSGIPPKYIVFANSSDIYNFNNTHKHIRTLAIAFKNISSSFI